MMMVLRTRALAPAASILVAAAAAGCSVSVPFVQRAEAPSVQSAPAAETGSGEAVVLAAGSAASWTADTAASEDQIIASADAPAASDSETAFSAASGPDTLRGALARVYASNPTLQAQRANLDAASESVTIARGNRFPQVSANAGYTFTDSSETDNEGAFNEFLQARTFSDRESEAFTTSAAISISQTLYAGGRVRAGIKAAAADREAARAAVLSTEQGVLLSGVSAYLSVRRDQEVVAIRANNVEVLARQLEAAQDRFEVGEVTRTDVAQAEARLAGAQTQLAAARADLAAARAVYQQVVGDAPGSLAPPPPVPTLPASFDEAVEQAADQNPSIISARFAEASARANVRSARSAFRPTIGASASASVAQRRGDFVQGRPDDVNDVFATEDNIDTDTEELSAGITASIPLFTGGANGARVRQARAAENQARLVVREAERAVLADVTAAWNSLIAARAQIVSSEEQVRASQVAFEGVEQEALVGGRTTLDVLDAEQELLDARLALVTAETDAYVAAFALLQTVGELTAARLDLD